MSALTWPYFAFPFVIVCLVIRVYGIRILETVVLQIIQALNPGILREGKQISGPKWRFPNGNVVERFTDGRANSELWQRYGPVYRLWSGFNPEIVITTPEALKHFSSDANDHPKALNVNLGWYVGEILGRALGLLYGQDWRRLRRTFEPPFTHSAAVSRLEDVESNARDYVNRLPLLATEVAGAFAKKNTKSFNLPLLQAFTKFPYFQTAAAIYGPMTEEEERDLWAVTEKRIALNQYWIGGGFYRSEIMTKLFRRSAIQRLREFNKEWLDYNARIVQRRRAYGTTAPIITYWEEYEKGNISMLELLHTLDELLMLNLDVITHVITWFILLIADHEDIKQELHDEVTVNESNLSRYIAKTDTHLHRCFIESMRVRPFAIFTIGESSSVVKDFHGVRVKPNTQILVDVLAINVRNSFWGPKSEAFDPSRLMHIKPSDLRYNLHSFGIGSRKCMGQFTAGHIAKSLAVHLFREYDVTVPKGGQGGGSYAVDKTSWTPKADVLLELARRQKSVEG
ncbi:cytochrome P450 monooxygenase GliC2 [Xylaria intraflava]|nr:cytochrome P450 monooxygenase GliC2 [Xylaria intraflava]